MLLETQDFYRLAEAEQSVPLKQKMFSFQEHFSHKKQKFRLNNHSTLGFFNPESKQQMQKTHFALRPKLPSKKLFQQPRFFMSLQRKRLRIIDGLKNVTKFQPKSSTTTSLKGRKLKINQSNQPKQQSYILSKSLLFEQKNYSAWQPKVKTPFLNYNMQYLIKKRKMMTPAVSSCNETISFCNKTRNRPKQTNQ